MSNESEITSTINEVSEVLNFLAMNFDHTGNSYMYEVLIELSDKLQKCNNELNKDIYMKSSIDVTNKIIQNLINK